MHINVNHTTLNVWDTASGSNSRPTLLFLHYFGGSGQTWNEVIDLLSSDFRCVAPDLRGFGSSAAPKNNALRVDDNVADVCALVQALGLTRFVLIGHSMGGKIAQATAARLQAATGAGGLQSLILVAPSPPTPEPMTPEDRDQMRQAWGNYEASLETVHRISRLPLSPTLVERTARDMLRASHEAYNAWLDVGSRENIVEQAATITLPVTVIAGENDPVMEPEILQREVVGHIKQARMVTVPGSGHLLPLEAAMEVAHYIRDAV